MQFPLSLSFRLLSFAPQLAVADAAGRTLFYVRQKLFKLRESVSVFADEAQNELVCTIEADRMIDFSARYTFRRGAATVGSLKRRGARSLWRAHYELVGPGGTEFSIHEENPWAKAVDGLLGDIPVVGVLTGYLLHPSYAVEAPDGTVVMRLVKQPSFFERRFTIDAPAPADASAQTSIVLGLVMVVLLERERG